MAEKKATRGAATEPVDASAIPQESNLEKPSKEELEKSGTRVPETFYDLEEAEGDLEAAARITAERTGVRTQDDVNAEADETQRAALERMGREYHIPGQKKAGGPTENKSATATDDDEARTTARKSARKSTR